MAPRDTGEVYGIEAGKGSRPGRPPNPARPFHVKRGALARGVLGDPRRVAFPQRRSPEAADEFAFGLWPGAGHLGTVWISVPVRGRPARVAESRRGAGAIAFRGIIRWLVTSVVLAIANQKGGVGKTTTAISIGAILADMGRRVLLVDIDPQANATSGLGVRREDVTASSYDVVVLGRPISEALLPTPVAGLDLVPSGIALAGSEIELVSMARRERRLTYALEAVEDRYDYILIDCPPSLGLLTVNGVVAAQALLVPIQCEFFALEGLTLLIHTLTLLRRQLNPTLAIAGIVMTLFDRRVALAGQVVDQVRARFPDELLEPVIPRNVRLSEAPSHGLPITLYDPACRGAVAYRELTANLEHRLRSLSAVAAGLP